MSSQISLVDFVKKIKSNVDYLISQWKVILIFSLLGTGLGIIYAWKQDSKYTAQLTFVTESEGSSGLGGYASIASQFGIDLGGGSNSIFTEDNLVSLLKSRSLIDKTLLSPLNNNILFIDQYVSNHKINSKWKNDSALSKINFISILEKKDFNRKRDSIFNSIADGIISSQLDIDKVDKKLDLIYIRMIDNDMFFAKAFAEKLAENAITFYTSYKTKKNQDNVNILQRQTDSVKSILFGNINEVASINDLNVNPVKQSLKTNGQKRQIEMQVNSVLYTELLKNLEISKLSLRKETPLIQIIDRPKLPLKNEKKGRLLFGLFFAFCFTLFSFVILLSKKWIMDQL